MDDGRTDTYNVVFIVLDTVRKDRLSVYNEDVDFTPHLERFAGDAVVFADAMAQAPWTLPSHASMFTGQYPWKHGATQQHLFLDRDEADTPLLAERFKNEGYQTACYTANTWISPYTGMADGFDEIDNFFPVLPSNVMPDVVSRVWQRLNYGYGETVLDNLMRIGEYFHKKFAQDGGDSKTGNVLEKAEDFISRCQSTGDPFFLFVNLMDAHLPYYPPEDYRERHAPDVDPQDVCQDAAAHNGGKHQAAFDAAQKLYDAEIDYLDDMLGQFFTFCNEHGLYEDTVFVVVADHGENLGEDGVLQNGMFGHQFSVSEQLVSVPLMVRTPDTDTDTDTDMGIDADSDSIDRQVELRELYDLVPGYAGLTELPEIGTAYAKGRYAYPRLDLKNIPSDRNAVLGKALTYVRGDGKKLVQVAGEHGDVVEEVMSDLSTGEELPVDSALQEQLPNRGDSLTRAEQDVTQLDEADERVKQRLEDLGYL